MEMCETSFKDNYKWAFLFNRTRSSLSFTRGFIIPLTGASKILIGGELSGWSGEQPPAHSVTFRDASKQPRFLHAVYPSILLLDFNYFNTLTLKWLA